MKTYYDEIEEKKNECSTLEDWKKFAKWLVEEVYNHNNEALYVQEAIVALYGNDGLDKVNELAAELEAKYLPSEICMHEFGYTNDRMMPIPLEFAVQMYEDGREVLLLFSNNTEEVAKTREQLEAHTGLFGITHEELARIEAELSEVQHE